jgi:hypothetical protein
MELASVATMTPSSQACGGGVEEISPQGSPHTFHSEI